MKPPIISLIIVCFTIITATAQDVTFGLKGGVNIANASQQNFDSQSITSFHIGGVMEALYTDKIALQTEILFGVQGFTTDDSAAQRDIKLTYINVPIMLKYYVKKVFYLEAGPQIGFLNTAKLKTTTSEESNTINIKEGLRSNDLSLNAGLGFQLNNGISINARYCYGLTNAVRSFDDDKFKNRVFQVSVGYFF